MDEKEDDFSWLDKCWPLKKKRGASQIQKTTSQNSREAERDEPAPESDPSVLNSKISNPKASIFWAPDLLYQFKNLFTLH